VCRFKSLAVRPKLAYTTVNPTADRDIAGVIAPPPLIYLAGLAVGFVLEALLPGGSFPGHVHHVVGAVLLLLGVGLMGWWVMSFRRAETPMPPWEPTTALVTGGPYRLTRNPAYLADALIYVAIALLADAPWALLPLPAVLAVMDRGVIAREERYLERRFGDDYQHLKARTRRWI
jgi:protein-S-isoprenylcysteine O-methyltransferase Ste14